MSSPRVLCRGSDNLSEFLTLCPAEHGDRCFFCLITIQRTGADIFLLRATSASGRMLVTEGAEDIARARPPTAAVDGASCQTCASIGRNCSVLTSITGESFYKEPPGARGSGATMFWPKEIRAH